MAKKKMKPKAKPLPAKKKGAAKKKSRPARGFDMGMVRLNELADHVADLTDRVRALERVDTGEPEPDPAYADVDR